MSEIAHRTPRLLVSVRNEQEARAAIAGGCDIVDIKEPNIGSLGRASLETINAIAEICRAQQVPVSVALGELPEWIDSPAKELDGLLTAIFSNRLSFAKLGLAGTGDRANWQGDWIDWVRSNSQAGSAPWIAVAYADWELADAPSMFEVLDVVTAAGSGTFAGLLIDTFDKSSGHLLACLSCAELVSIREQLSDAGQQLALAGKLNPRLLGPLIDVAPDVVAIRGAACEDSDRTGRISQQRVTQFRREIGHVFSDEVSESTG